MVTMPNILELPLLVSWLIQRQQKEHTPDLFTVSTIHLLSFKHKVCNKFVNSLLGMSNEQHGYQ